MTLGKRTIKAREGVDREKLYPLQDAVKMVKERAKAKFDETIEIAMNLGVDPRHADQMVRGVVNLPNGSGRSVRVAVFARGAKADEAKAAGADVVGAEDLVEKVQGGNIDFDRCIATPDLMPLVGRLGKVLGPRGLMPNPKLGTVTFDVGRAVREAKAGKVEFRVDKAGNVHVPIGKKSFSAEHLQANAMAVIEAIMRGKPAAAKGQYLRSMTVSATMGPGVRIDVQKVAIAEYRGLTVRQLSELRKQLRGASAECRIVKNRIAKLAIAGSPLGGLSSHLKGPTAIVFSAQDPVAVAKTLHTFGKTNQQLLVKAGFVDGQLLPATELRRLADLPSRDALRGQLVSTLQGPLAQLVGLLRAPLRDRGPGRRRSAGGRRRHRGGRGHPPLLLQQLAELGRLEQRELVELFGDLFDGGCHESLLLLLG